MTSKFGDQEQFYQMKRYLSEVKDIMKKIQEEDRILPQIIGFYSTGVRVIVHGTLTRKPTLSMTKELLQFLKSIFEDR